MNVTAATGVECPTIEKDGCDDCAEKFFSQTLSLLPEPLGRPFLEPITRLRKKNSRLRQRCLLMLTRFTVHVLALVPRRFLTAVSILSMPFDSCPDPCIVLDWKPNPTLSGFSGFYSSPQDVTRRNSSTPRCPCSPFYHDSTMGSLASSSAQWCHFNKQDIFFEASG